MDNNTVVSIIAQKNGRFTSIKWESNQARKMSAVAKKSGVTLTKVTSMTARADIKYEHTAEYDKHNHDVPSWCERVEGCNGLVRHKTTGKLYLQVYPSHNSNQIQSQFYLNGQPIDRETALEMLQPSQRQSSQSDIICIALDDIISIA